MECLKPLKAFQNYVEHMLMKGLRVEHVTYEDWCEAMDFVERYGLLPANAVHVAVALYEGGCGSDR